MSKSVPLTEETLGAADAAVIVTSHRAVDYGMLLKHASLVIDSRNVTQGLTGKARVIRLGAPLPA